jgi:hypothetical protein
MAGSEDPGPPYEVHISGIIRQALRRLQRRAAREGRGEEVLAAMRRISQRLRDDPFQLGEPAFRLPSLRMQVRGVVDRPLVVPFGVCEDRPLVFLRGVRLLSPQNLP